MKKIFSVLLAVLILVSLAVPAFAFSSEQQGYLDEFLSYGITMQKLIDSIPTTDKNYSRAVELLQNVHTTYNLWGGASGFSLTFHQLPLGEPCYQTKGWVYWLNSEGDGGNVPFFCVNFDIKWGGDIQYDSRETTDFSSLNCSRPNLAVSNSTVILNATDGTFRYLLPPFEDYPGGGGSGSNDEYFARIMLPQEGFKQSKLNAVLLKLHYRIPYDGNQNSIFLKVNGYVQDTWQVQAHNVMVSEDGKTFEGYLDVVGAARWNIPTTLIFTATDYLHNTYSDSVTVTCYDDFIDEDGDGKDDRTGQDEWTGGSDFKPWPGGGGGSGGGSGGDGGGTVTDPTDLMKQAAGFLGGFPSFLKGIFDYVPVSVWVLIALGVAVIVILRVLGR